MATKDNGWVYQRLAALQIFIRMFNICGRLEQLPKNDCLTNTGN